MKRLTLVLVLVAGCPARGPAGWVDPPADGVEITCPVERTRCVKTPEMASAVYEERTYYFCEAGSRPRFLADPTAFADR